MSDSPLYNNLYNPDVLSCLANLSNDEVFTPPQIVNAMLDMLPQSLFRSPDTTFLDPVVKSGVFLREIAKRLLKGLEDVIPDRQARIDHIFQKQLFGIAITELTSLLARRSVYCSKFPNGVFSVTHFDSAEGNIRFRNIPHTWKDGRCVYCGASQKEYGGEKREGRETHAYELIHTIRPEEIFNMKFDVVVGNPPYQLSDGGAQASASPLYNQFVQQAKKLNPHYLSMIIPARWYAAGKGLESFRNDMLNDIHIKELHDFPNTQDCFPGVNIRGGICYFLWDNSYDNRKCGTNVVTHIGSEISSFQRPLKIQDLDIFLRNSNAIKIIDKVSTKREKTLDAYISAAKAFGKRTFFINDPSFHESKEGLKNPIICYGRAGKIGYVEKQEIDSHKDWIDLWKVYVPESNNIGTELNDDNQNSFVGQPGSICTETFLVVGAELNLTESSANNLAKYLKTTFARFLLSLAKISQHGTAKTYRFVPVQDFSKAWTDEELFFKYSLNEEEIAFIENMIKPME